MDIKAKPPVKAARRPLLILGLMPLQIPEFHRSARGVFSYFTQRAAHKQSSPS